MNIKFHHLALLLIVSLTVGSCAVIQQNFFSTDDTDDYPRAFYIEQKENVRPDNQMVRMRAPLDQVARVVSGVMEEITDTTVSVLRVPEGDVVSGNMMGLMRVTTPRISADSLDQFREFFNIGEYLLDQEDFMVRHENMRYTVEAIIYLRGQELVVNFTMIGALDWNIYQKTSRNERKVDRRERVKYAVGSYRYQQPVERVNWRGNVYEAYEWVVVDINDKPTTKGVLESRLRTRLIEKAAIENISAGLITRF